MTSPTGPTGPSLRTARDAASVAPAGGTKMPFAGGGHPSLLVSLPTNDVELARAAVAGGADGVKAHLHVSHRVSGASFGDFAQEQAGLAPILALDVPVGLVVGSTATRDELAAARADGVAFFDTFLAGAPADYVTAAAPAAAMVAVTADTDPGQVAALDDLGVAAVEAALTAPDDYATVPTLPWLAQLSHLVGLTRLPIVVPTQHAITPDHLGALVDVGIGALLLGAVVTGADPRDVEATTRRFRDHLDGLGPTATP